MDRGAWRATDHGVARVRHDLVTKPPPPKYGIRGFRRVPVVKYPPAIAGNTGLIPSWGRFHMPQSNYTPAPQLLKPMLHNESPPRNRDPEQTETKKEEHSVRFVLKTFS